MSFSSVASNEVSGRSLVIPVPSALPSIFDFIIADPDAHQIQLLVAAFCLGSLCITVLLISN